MTMRPESISSSPFRQRKKVDLPEPLGPTTTTTSLKLTDKEKSTRARTPPGKVFFRFWAMTTGPLFLVFMGLPFNRQAPGQPVHQKREAQGEHQVYGRHREPDFKGQKGLGDYLLTPAWSDHRWRWC